MAIAFNGADGFSTVAWARVMLDVSGKNISVINEIGNKFIQGLRRTDLFQPSDFIKFSLVAEVILALSEFGFVYRRISSIPS